MQTIMYFDNGRWRLSSTSCIVLTTIILFGLAVMRFGGTISEASTGEAASSETWQTEVWTNNDKTLRQIRLGLDQQIAAAKQVDEIVNERQASASQHPSDVNVIYSFAYAVYSAAVHYKDTTHLVDAINAMNRVPLTHSYEFDRLHFLLECRVNANSSLKPIGLRLVRHNPHDYEVKYQFVKTLDPGWNPVDRQMALKYTSELIHQAPTSPRVYALQGYTYDIAYGQNHKPADGEAAIRGYQHYLRIAPANDSFREAAVSHIKFIQKVMSLLRQHKAKQNLSHRKGVKT